MLTGHRDAAPCPFPVRLMRLAVLAIACLLALPAPAATDFDRWFVVLIDGERCGWSHEWQATEGDRVTSATVVSLAFERGDDDIAIDMETEFVETLRGEPISCRAVQSIGAEPITREFTWTEDSVVVVTEQGGRESRAEFPRPSEAWLTPAGAAEFVRARLEAGAETIEYRSLDPTEGLVFSTTTMDRFEPVRVDLLDESVEATACRVRSTSLPGIETPTWIDGDGRTLRTQLPLGSATMTMVMADQATAMEPGEAPELMVRTLITPDRPIARPRQVREASYILRLSGDGVVPDLPATSNQSTEGIGRGAVRVVVDPRRPAIAEVADRADYLSSSTMLDIDDPEIVDLAARSLRSAPRDPARRAEALRRAVYRHIRDKTLGVGFATASEVCRTRTGDCTEHGVLLAALLRADGIPSRVVSGVVYVDEFLGQEGVFGFHMWTQALVQVDGEPRWIDLDAALSPSSPFDATHIALAVSGLGDSDGPGEMAAIVSMIGTLEIEVERAER